MKKYGICVMAVLLAAGFSTQSIAAPNMGGSREAMMRQRPVLTPAQIAQYKAARDANRAAMTAQRAQMNGLTDQLRAEMKKKPADKNKIQSLMNQIDIQRETMQIQQMESMMKQRPNLTPEQQKRFNDMIQKAKDRLAKRQAAAK